MMTLERGVLLLKNSILKNKLSHERRATVRHHQLRKVPPVSVVEGGSEGKVRIQSCLKYSKYISQWKKTFE
jgi:hypothetical protein